MKTRILSGAAIGLIIGLPWLAVVYLGWHAAGLPFLPVELFDLLTRSLPGSVVTAGIEVLVRVIHSLQMGPTATLGKLAEFLMAYAASLVGLALLGALFALAAPRLPGGWRTSSSLAGLALWAATSGLAAWGGWGKPGPVLGMLWLLATSLGWSLSLAWGVEQSAAALTAGEDHRRRAALAKISLGSAALTGLAIGLGRWLAVRPAPTPELELIQGTPIPPNPTPTRLPTKAGFEPVAGTRPEITPLPDFYRVDINLLPPGTSEFEESADNLTQRLLAQGGETDLPAADYVLMVDGLVEEPVAFDLAALKAFPHVLQYATLECISNPVGGDLISTTLFEGVRLKDVLERARLKPGAVDVKITCVDGYTESLPIEAALDARTLLCFAMGGQPLSQEHGAPLRLYTPNRFGMKNPKWIIKIEAVDLDYKGYWERRGWSDEAWVQTTAVIDATQKEQEGQVEAGGIAFAGERGIAHVEVKVDEGEWLAAELDRPLSPLTWVLWRAALALPQGNHRLTVRAMDGQGVLQTETKSSTHPDGATGYHSIEV